jgi:hypothetical protein
MFETTYGPIEAALMTAHGISTKLQGAFRGRLAALQKRGLLGRENMPGKGRALRYGPDQLHRLVFACEMLEFGVAPALVLAIVERLWESRLGKIFDAAERAAMGEPGGDDVILHLAGVHLLGDTLGDAVPNVGACRLAKLRDQMAMWMQLAPDDAVPPRAMVVNLTMRLRAFHSVFARAYMADLTAERARIDAKIEAAAEKIKVGRGTKRK